MKIAIVGQIHQKGVDVLQEHGLKSVEVTNTDEENLIKNLSDVDGVILRTANISNNVLEKCPNIKIISRHGVGYDNVDINHLNQNKIALSITGSANAISVSEHVMAFFLQLTKIINLSDRLTRKGKFEDRGDLPDFFELYQKKVLILGFGRIGQAVAKRCLGFEMDVYVYDPFVDVATIKSQNCCAISKEEGLKKADYVSVHLPLNNDTRGFIGSEEFKNMKSNVILVNTARGGIVDEKSLFDALNKKQISGAGLDVFEKEPPDIQHPLFSLSNVILTPHNAALSLECRIRMAIESCENVAFYLGNIAKLNKNNIVNKKILGF